MKRAGIIRFRHFVPSKTPGEQRCCTRPPLLLPSLLESGLQPGADVLAPGWRSVSLAQRSWIMPRVRTRKTRLLLGGSVCSGRPLGWRLSRDSEGRGFIHLCTQGDQVRGGASDPSHMWWVGWGCTLGWLPFDKGPNVQLKSSGTAQEIERGRFDDLFIMGLRGKINWLQIWCKNAK